MSQRTTTEQTYYESKETDFVYIIIHIYIYTHTYMHVCITLKRSNN